MKRTAMIVVLLVLAFGGAAAAGGKITGKHIKDRSVTGVDIRDGSVRSSDVADGTLVAADFGDLTGLKGEVGPTGPQGDRGPQGPQGVPDLYQVMTTRVIDPMDPSEVWTAACTSGELIGGGVSILDPTNVTIVESSPVRSAGAWSAHVTSSAAQPTEAYAWAICGDVL